MDLIEILNIRRYDKNSRTHPAAQIRAIARSIDDVGLVATFPLRDGVLAKGHGTLEAVELLIAEGKLIYPPPGRAAGADPFPAGLVPYIDVSAWSDAQFRAYVIADNALGEMSGWDEAVLKLEVNDLLAGGVDAAALGMDAADIEELNALGAMAKSFDRGAEKQADGEDHVEYQNLAKFPLTVILDAAEYDRWAALKAKKRLSDKLLLLNLMENESC